MLKLSDFTLSEFKNHKLFQEPIKTGQSKPSQLKKYLYKMLLIRMVEKQLAEGKRDGIIGGPVHLGVGQEAIATGVSESLKTTDRVFGAHRSHSHILAMNQEVQPLFAEVLGKVTGYSKGMGGSMHLWSQPFGFYGSVPIVAGTVSIAVGAAMAAKLQGTDDVAVVYLGDGAMEEGIVHESMNLARIYKIPIMFVVENNLFASHMHISTRQPKESTSRFAWANDIPYCLVDGNDVVQVKDTAQEMLQKSRNGDGPVFLEAITYRWYGHVDWREDIDVGVNRSREELEKWRSRDPIRRLKESMIQSQLWSEKEDQELHKSLYQKIQNAWHQAIKDPYPGNDATLEMVYKRT